MTIGISKSASDVELAKSIAEMEMITAPFGTEMRRQADRVIIACYNELDERYPVVQAHAGDVTMAELEAAINNAELDECEAQL
jgi:hypothetical protein